MFLAQHLAIYFVTMLAMCSFAMELTPATLWAVKFSPPLVIAAVGALAAGTVALFDWSFFRRAFHLGALDRIRHHRFFTAAARFANLAPFWMTFVFAALPLPLLIARILVPLSGYSRLRYATAVLLGRFPRLFVIASFGVLLDIPTPVIAALFAGAVLIAAIAALVRHFRPVRRAQVDASSTNSTGSATSTSSATRSPLPPAA